MTKVQYILEKLKKYSHEFWKNISKPELNPGPKRSDFKQNELYNEYLHNIQKRNKNNKLLFCQKFTVQTANAGNSNIKAFRIIPNLT